MQPTLDELWNEGVNEVMLAVSMWFDARIAGVYEAECLEQIARNMKGLKVLQERQTGRSAVEPADQIAEYLRSRGVEVAKTS